MRHLIIAVAVSAILTLDAATIGAQERTLSLESVEGLRVHNVFVTAATHKGKRGVRVLEDTSRVRGQANVERWC